MSKTKTYGYALLRHILNNVAMANIGDTSGLQPAGAAGNLYLGLYTINPGRGADQTTNELTYTSYVRIPIARTTGGWTCVNPGTDQPAYAYNTAEMLWAACTGAAGETATYWGVGTAVSGAGELLYATSITDPVDGITIGIGSIPRAAISGIVITED